jgi:sugar phosphate isomerase/epimerase
MIRSAITISLVPEARGGPFVFCDDLSAGCAQAAVFGFDAVEVFPESGNAIPLSAIKAELNKNKLTLAAVGTGAGWLKHKLRLTDPDPTGRARAREFVFGIINFAGFCGAPAIVGSMQGRWDAEPAEAGRERALDWLAEELRALSERSAAHGQVLFYEPLNRYETNLFNSAAAAATFLDRRQLQHVKLLCDLYHMNIEEADISAALRQVGPRLGHVHFADSNRRAIGLGHTDVAPIAMALRDIGYGGYVSAEILPLPDAATAAQQTITSFRRFFPRPGGRTHPDTATAASDSLSPRRRSGERAGERGDQ